MTDELFGHACRFKTPSSAGRISQRIEKLADLHVFQMETIAAADTVGILLVEATINSRSTAYLTVYLLGLVLIYQTVSRGSEPTSRYPPGGN